MIIEKLNSSDYITLNSFHPNKDFLERSTDLILYPYNLWLGRLVTIQNEGVLEENNSQFRQAITVLSSIFCSTVQSITNLLFRKSDQSCYDAIIYKRSTSTHQDCLNKSTKISKIDFVIRWLFWSSCSVLYLPPTPLIALISSVFLALMSSFLLDQVQIDLIKGANIRQNTIKLRSLYLIMIFTVLGLFNHYVVIASLSSLAVVYLVANQLSKYSFSKSQILAKVHLATTKRFLRIERKFLAIDLYYQQQPEVILYAYKNYAINLEQLIHFKNRLIFENPKFIIEIFKLILTDSRFLGAKRMAEAKIKWLHFSKESFKDSSEFVQHLMHLEQENFESRSLIGVELSFEVFRHASIRLRNDYRFVESTLIKYPQQAIYCIDHLGPELKASYKGLDLYYSFKEKLETTNFFQADSMFKRNLIKKIRAVFSEQQMQEYKEVASKILQSNNAMISDLANIVVDYAYAFENL